MTSEAVFSRDEARRKALAYRTGTESPLDPENIDFHMHSPPFDLRLVPYMDELVEIQQLTPTRAAISNIRAQMETAAKAEDVPLDPFYVNLLALVEDVDDRLTKIEQDYKRLFEDNPELMRL